jgi:hypothetical protein
MTDMPHARTPAAIPPLAALILRLRDAALRRVPVSDPSEAAMRTLASQARREEARGAVDRLLR